MQPLVAAFVGLSLVGGALVAVLFRLPERTAEAVTAFGGGVLLAAVALELLPEADQDAGRALTAAGLAAGTAVYVAADAALGRMPTGRHHRLHHVTGPEHAEAARGESIAAGLFVDGVPESLALGLTVANGELGVALLAGVLVGNVVEAHGAARPILAGGHSRRFALTLLGVIGASLAAATALGGSLLAAADPAIVGTAQAVAAGAVLAVVSIAIIPHAFAAVSRLVATATVLGFVAGYLVS